MGRPYGKTPRRKRGATKGRKASGGALKITMRHPDGAPLTTLEAGSGFEEVVRRLQADKLAKSITSLTIYVRLADADGCAYVPPGPAEWDVRPYRSAADEAGL